MARRHTATILLVSACALLALVEVPLTLRRPLTPDCVLFDLEWRTFSRGGVLYRDIFQTNPPGTLWIHAAVRTLLGPSSEALRAFDLVLMGTAIGCLAVWTVRLGGSREIASALALLLIWFYGSQSIWCQCQRDGWMLSIALLAIELRWRRGSAIGTSLTRWRVLTFLEGCLWGCAVWIKPFVMLPAAAVWLADRRRPAQEQQSAAQLPGLLAGGLLIGGLGLWWMIGTGTWPHFLEVNTGWNADYFSAGKMTPGLLLALMIQFGPWFLLNLLAPCLLWLWWRERSALLPEQNRARSIFGAFYLGWAAQAFLLQHAHAYVHLPVLMIAAPIVAATPQLTGARLWRPAFALWILGFLVMSPLARFQHLSAWPRCLAGPVTPELRTEIRGPLDRVYPGAPDLPQLALVEEFLRSQGVGDGEVTCYSYSTMPLYQHLDLEPPCRFICPRIYANRFFVHRRDDIARLLEASPQRYVVTDLVIDRFSEEEANRVGTAGRHAPPPEYVELPGSYPWSHPVVFRAGRYMVHEIRGPMGDFTSMPPRRSDVTDSARGVRSSVVAE